MIFDTHCHLFQYDHADDTRAQLLTRPIDVTVVTESPAEFAQILPWIGDTKNLHPAIGMIPQDINRLAPERDRLLETLPKTQYVGEIGIDYVTQDQTERRLQEQVFESILASCAEAGNKIITIHSRRASQAVLDRIGKKFPGVAILHWFSGSVAEIEAACSEIYFSINPAMVRSRSQKKLIAAMNPDRILLETDGPYVLQGKLPAQPQDLHHVIHYFARLWDIPPSEAEAKIESNYRCAAAKISLPLSN